MKLFRYLFFLISISTAMLCMVYLRTLNGQEYYKCRKNVVVIEKLSNELVDKRVALERLTNPQAVKNAVPQEDSPE